MIWLLLLLTLLALMVHFAVRQARLNLVPDQTAAPRRPARLDTPLKAQLQPPLDPRHPA